MIYTDVCKSTRSGGKDAVDGTMPTNTTPATNGVGQKAFCIFPHIMYLTLYLYLYLTLYLTLYLDLYMYLYLPTNTPPATKDVGQIKDIMNFHFSFPF